MLCSTHTKHKPTATAKHTSPTPQLKTNIWPPNTDDQHHTNNTLNDNCNFQHQLCQQHQATPGPHPVCNDNYHPIDISPSPESPASQVAHHHQPEPIRDTHLATETLHTQPRETHTYMHRLLQFMAPVLTVAHSTGGWQCGGAWLFLVCGWGLWFWLWLLILGCQMLWSCCICAGCGGLPADLLLLLLVWSLWRLLFITIDVAVVVVSWSWWFLWLQKRE